MHFSLGRRRALDGTLLPFRPSKRVLRDVTLTGRERLLTWDTGRKDWRGQTVIGYSFWPDYRHPGVQPLFTGSDFSGSPMHADDSDEVLRSLLGFLTLRPGDTDSDYFAEYDEEQLAYAESSECERHQMWVWEERPFWDRKRKGI